MELIFEIVLELLEPTFHGIGFATLRIFSLGSYPRSFSSGRAKRICTVLGVCELLLVAGLVGWWLQPRG